MSTFEIPLDPSPQVFSIVLDGVAYVLTLIWRDFNMGGWVLDIADQTGAPIVGGLPLVTGADLLAQFAYLGIGGQLAVQTDHNPDAVPTFTNLGISSHLYFTTPDDG